MPLHKVGVNFHKSIGFELGLLAFNYVDKDINFLETSISSEIIFKSDVILIPKLNIDAGTSFGTQSLLLLVGGLNIGLPTDFKETDVAIVPKIGFSYATIIRIYYSYIFFRDGFFKDSIGQNQITIELNIAAFHDLKIGL